MLYSPHILTLAQAAADPEAPTGLLARLLGLRRIDPTDGSLLLTFQHQLPAWLWLLALVAACFLAGQSYRRMTGNRAARITLAAIRAVLIFFAVVLIAQPALVKPQEHMEKGHVLMLLDRSESMTIRDVPNELNNQQPRSRNEQMQDLLRHHDDLFQSLGENHNVRWIGFGDRVTDLRGHLVLDPPDGRATAMRSAIDESIRRVAGKPVSAVVVWSDGRSSQTIGVETLNRLKQVGAPVWTVPVGSTDPMADLVLQRVQWPDRAFVNDTVPITLSVSSQGDDLNPNAPAPTGTRVRLVDLTTGQTLDTQTVTHFDTPLRLLTTPRAAGLANWSVRLESDTTDINPTNNTQPVELTLIDRPIRILYVEGYPRWEYRYLKNMLVRETTVSSSIMLISADQSFAQEGDIPLARLPRTADEFDTYDVIILGDVPVNFFSNTQLQLIRQHVANNGAGLLWIAGPRDMPYTYGASQLAALLPTQAINNLNLLDPPVAIAPTHIAESLGVLRLMTPERAVDLTGDNFLDTEATWPTDLPGLLWVQSLPPVKPAAEVLAATQPGNRPVVVRMRYGAGQSLYVGTDETWRWRYGKGELYMDQFWMQTIRLLARSRLDADDDRATGGQLIVSRRRIATGHTMPIELRITDPNLLQQAPEQIQVRVTPERAAGASPLLAGPTTETLTLTATDDPGHYRAVWTPTVAGKMDISVTSPQLADQNLSQTLTVERDDDEMRYPATDHAALLTLADKTGGRMLGAEEIDQLASLPQATRYTPADITEPLWNSPLAFALVIILLTAEWIARRLIGLI
ncbi:MAG: hypothetical protein ACYTGQ_01005 [Planctomycetota bacterium]|jgi:hypothetical protein